MKKCYTRSRIVLLNKKKACACYICLLHVEFLLWFGGLESQCDDTWQGLGLELGLKVLLIKRSAWLDSRRQK